MPVFPWCGGEALHMRASTPSQILHPGLQSCGAQEAGHSGLGGCTEYCHVTALLNCTWHLQVDSVPEAGPHSHVLQSSSFAMHCLRTGEWYPCQIWGQGETCNRI